MRNAVFPQESRRLHHPAPSLWSTAAACCSVGAAEIREAGEATAESGAAPATVSGEADGNAPLAAGLGRRRRPTTPSQETSSARRGQRILGGRKAQPCRPRRHPQRLPPSATC